MTLFPRQAPIAGRPPTLAALVAANALAGAFGCAPMHAAPAPGVDILIVEAASAEAPGGLAVAIEAANAARRPVRIVSRLPRGTEIYVTRELPWLSGTDVTLEGNGLVLRDRDCVRRDERRGCSGLVVTGTRVTVRDVEATGFRFDGVSVRRATDVTIAASKLWANLDDGVGISEVSKRVTVKGCLLEANGFRSKGKGILVFDESEASLLDNVVVGNRDGVTISKRSHALLERNRILESYDKGLGIAGASAIGRDNVIADSGRGRRGLGSGANADGLRVTLDSVVRLENSAIVGSGDGGVVVEGTSRVELVGVRFADNAGGDARASPSASLVIDGRVIQASAEGPDAWPPR
jgi:hypothetical protein